MTEKMLEHVEKCLENDPHWKDVREKTQITVDASPTSVSNTNFKNIWKKHVNILDIEYRRRKQMN